MFNFHFCHPGERLTRRLMSGSSSIQNGGGLFCFAFFCLCQFLSLTRELWITLGFEWFRGVAFSANAVSPMFLFLCVCFYDGFRLVKFQESTRKLIWVILLSIPILTFYGGFHFIWKEVFIDAKVYSIWIFGIILGSHDVFWQDALRLMFWIFLASFLVCVCAFILYRDVFIEAQAGVRVSRDSLVYELTPSMGFMFPLLFFAITFSSFRRMVVMFGLLSFIGFQVLFQKRLEVVYGIMILGVVSYLFLSVKEVALRQRAQSSLVILVFVSCSVILAGIIWSHDVLLNHFWGLLERFSGRDTEYSSGFLSTFSLENERVGIVYECFSSFSLMDWIFGRGFGGAFVYNPFSLELMSNESYYTATVMSFFIPEINDIGRRGFEVGFLMPLFKGGCFFWLLLLGLVIKAFKSVPWRLLGFCERTALAFALIYFIRMLQGGSFVLGDSFHMLGFSLSLGLLLSRNPELRGRYE